MGHVQVQARIPGRSADAVFAILSDLEQYATGAESVRSISVSQQDGMQVSAWEVDFHGGIMRWREQDVLLPSEHAIRFQQLDGDMDSFSGEWRLSEDGVDCLVAFRADFELGIPGLKLILEPIAASALRQNIQGILSGLLGATDFA